MWCSCTNVLPNTSVWEQQEWNKRHRGIKKVRIEEWIHGKKYSGHQKSPDCETAAIASRPPGVATPKTEDKILEMELVFAAAFANRDGASIRSCIC